MSCETTECHDYVNKGSNISVYIQGSDCTRQLKSSSTSKGAAIPIQLNGKLVELRNGSLDYPIKLEQLQSHNGPSVPFLLAALADGTIVKWSAAAIGKNDQKLITKDGVFTHANDYISDLLDGAICEADCDEVESTLGVKTITHRCLGQPDRVMYQLCRIPRCCCTEEDFPSLVV